MDMAFESIFGQYSPVVTSIAVSFGILLAGYIVGKFAESFVVKTMENIGVKRKVRFGIEREIKKFGIAIDMTKTFAALLKYFVYLSAVVFAVDFLGVRAMSDVVNAVWVYAPNIFATMLIIMIGTIITELVAGIVKFKLYDYGIDDIAKEIGVDVKLSSVIALFLKYFLYLVIGVAALTQLGFQTQSISSLVTSLGTVGIISVSLVFIISVKDVLPNITAGMYIRSSGSLKKGEKITAEGINGKVKHVGFVFTELESGKKRIIVPNSALVKGKYTISK